MYLINEQLNSRMQLVATELLSTTALKGTSKATMGTKLDTDYYYATCFSIHLHVNVSKSPQNYL